MNKYYNINIVNVKPIKTSTTVEIFQQFNDRNTFRHKNTLHGSWENYWEHMLEYTLFQTQILIIKFLL